MLKRSKSKKELEEIGKLIKGESSIDKAIGMYNDRVKALFKRILPEMEKRVTDRM